MDESSGKRLGRRGFLQRAGGAVGGAALLPMLGAGDRAASALPATGSGGAGPDPDELFRAGRFAEADRGYARLLRRNPDDAHAWAQRGYIALLSNSFADCEEFLTRAIALAPTDHDSRRRLAESFARQDDFARAVPVLRETGQEADEARATLYASLTGTPYEVRGAQVTRVPFLGLDPLPHFRGSLNGGEPRTLLFDTGAATLHCAAAVAEELGLRSVSTMTGNVGGRTVTLYQGVLESLRLGEIELRNFPVQWTDEASERPPPDGLDHDGVIGTTLFYHFLTTLDYAGQGLVLRRRTPENQRAFRAEARRARAESLPMWLVGDHMPCTLGSIDGHGPRVASFDTGAIGMGIMTSVAMAERLGIDVDYDNPIYPNGGDAAYPIAPDEISLGRAVGRHVPGIATSRPLIDDMAKFETIGNFTHEFFKPFAITLDFADMTLYITGA